MRMIKNQIFNKLEDEKMAKKAEYGNDLAHCAKLAMEQDGENHLILTLGCGNVYRCAQLIANQRKQDKN